MDSRKVEELDNPHEILKILIDLVSFFFVLINNQHGFLEET